MWVNCFSNHNELTISPLGKTPFAPSINIGPGGFPPVGKYFQGARYPRGWLHHSKFINIFILLYIITVLLACKKSVTTKMCEKKSEKITPYRRHETWSILLKTP